MKRKYSATYKAIVRLNCECCTEFEDREEDYDSLQDAFDDVEDQTNWRIYEDGKLILKGG